MKYHLSTIISSFAYELILSFYVVWSISDCWFKGYSFKSCRILFFFSSSSFPYRDCGFIILFEYWIVYFHIIVQFASALSRRSRRKLYESRPAIDQKWVKDLTCKANRSNTILLYHWVRANRFLFNSVRFHFSNHGSYAEDNITRIATPDVNLARPS